MDKKIKKGSGFSFWDNCVRNPILVKKGVDIAKGFEQSQAASEETSDVSQLIALLGDVFGVGQEYKFTTKEVYLAITNERFLDDHELAKATAIKNNNEDNCIALRDAMIGINAKSASILKSTGKVLSGLADRVSEDYRFVRHKTRSKAAIKHWVELTEDAYDRIQKENGMGEEG